jgi:hypothetical protein
MSRAARQTALRSPTDAAIMSDCKALRELLGNLSMSQSIFNLDNKGRASPTRNTSQGESNCSAISSAEANRRRPDSVG